jgi:exopolysaccharide biosynthesis protein
VKTRWLPIILLLMLLFALPAFAEVSYEEHAFDETAEYIDLEDLIVTDFESFAAFLQQFPNLKQVDMWGNKMTREQCDFLASKFPEMRWGWTMVIKRGKCQHLIRTDFTSWSTLHNNKSPHHSSEDFKILKYCWNLMALDVGHNEVTDLDFLYDLPNLRVLIIACNQVEDITPIASLKKLEYAELFNNKIRDITPLTGLPHLMDLNICFNRISDLSPILTLPSLKRLWLYSHIKRNVPASGEQVDAIRAAFPDLKMDTTHYSTNGEWRYLDGYSKVLDPHYAVILKIFGVNHLHPATEYMPFEDSFFDEDVPEPAENPPLALLEPQDFSDKNYLLPIDFSPGKAPKASGYKDENTYEDSTISVSVGSGKYQDKCQYWYADITVKDPSQIRTLAANMNGSFQEMGQIDAERLAERCGGVIAINGDYYTSSEKYGLGYIVRQGVLYENNLERQDKAEPALMDVLVIDEDGDFIGIHQPRRDSINSLVKGKRALNTFSFGPILVEKGRAVESFYGTDRWVDMERNKPHQRIAICQTGHLQYKVVCCAGPAVSGGGLTIPQFADLLASLKVQTAYNLDGGDSTLIWFNGKKVNDMGYNTRRKLTDIIYFASAE